MNNWALFLVEEGSDKLVWSSLNSFYYWYGEMAKEMQADAKRRDGKYLHWNDMHCTYVYVELEEEEL